jgi:hypothetical protein
MWKTACDIRSANSGRRRADLLRVISLVGKREDVEMEAALQWNEGQAALPIGRRAEDAGFAQAPRRHEAPPDAGDELGRLV